MTAVFEAPVPVGLNELIPGIGYKRVSRVMGRGGEGFISEEVQEAQILACAAANGIRIVKWFSEVDVSGGTVLRDEFQNVLAALKGGEEQAVVVATLSRAFRNIEDAMRERREIRDAGGELYAANVPNLPGVVGERLYIQQAAEDHLFLVDNKEKWLVNLQTSLNKGIYRGNRPPTGYEWERAFDGPDGRRCHRLRVVEELREPVRRIFIGRAHGLAWTELAAEFEASTGIHLNPQSLKRIVENRAYRGEAHAKGFEPNLEAHEPIVSEAEFQAAQSKHVRASRPSRRGQPRSLLAGILHCGSCGRPMSYRGGKGMQYTCQRFGGGEACAAPVLIAAGRIDDHVLSLVRSEIDGILARGVPSGRRLELLEAKVADAQAELTMYVEDTSISEIGREAYARGKAVRVERLAAAVAERDAELAGAGGLDEQFLAWLKLFDELGVEHQRKVVARLIDRATVSRLPAGAPTHSPIEGRVEVDWNQALRASSDGEGRARS